MITLAEVIEACAKVCEEAYPYSVFHTDQRASKNCAAAIRALAAQYEGCIVAELPAAHGRSVGVPLYRAKEAK
jgi:hypothetical protein